MGKYQLDLFNHRLSVDPEFRSGILAGAETAWSAIPLTPDERRALETADIAWLHAALGAHQLVQSPAKHRSMKCILG